MDVFLVPIGPESHALYCEVDTAAAAEPRDGPRTLWTRMTDTFGRAVAEGEAEAHDEPAPVSPPRSRLRRWVTRRLADAVAEQRLLWHLRQQATATLVHPRDVPAARSLELMRARLTHDFSRHRLWCVIDAAIATATIPIAIVPGPNVLGYYFVFRAVGHLFSLRGARRGLRIVTWHTRESGPLADVRLALALDAAARRAALQAIADDLGLSRLAKFVERMAARS